MPSKSDTKVEISIASPSEKEASLSGELIEIDGNEFPFSETIILTLSVEV